MAIAVGDILELRIFCQLVDQGSVNVRQYRVSQANGGPWNISDITDSISASVAGNLKPLLSAEATFRGIGLRHFFPLPKSLEYTSTSGAGAGQVSGFTLPKQAAGIFTITTQFAGRGYRGRMYVPFPAVSSNGSDGVPTAGYMANLTTLATFMTKVLNFGVAPNQLALQPILWHRKSLSSTDQTGFKTPQKWATQRRRGDYGRPNWSPV